MKKILLLDDHPLVLLALESVIESAFPAAQIFKTETTPEALEILKKYPIDLILLDLGLPDQQPQQTIKLLRDVQKDLPILICTGRDESANALFYINNGVNGFISKNAPPKQIILAINTVLNKKIYVSQQIQNQIITTRLNGDDATDNPLELLSDREREIMDLLLSGMGTKEISTHLNIAFSTVSTHKMNILEKFQAKNLLELYKKAELYL